MPSIEVAKENSLPVKLYYEDLGEGRPVVLIHGWPLSGRSWERQVPALVENGYRVIAYDRRGFGYSGRPSSGYDYDTFAADLDKLMTELDLRQAVLVGFSMGSGEVARYLGKYGSDRVSRAVMIGAIPPFLLKTADNPAGVDAEVFEDIKSGIKKDRLAFLTRFFNGFYNADELLGDRLSEEVIRWSWNTGSWASPIAFLACVDAWTEDFREDVDRIDVPTLVIHGDADKILPFEATAAALAGKLKGARLVKLSGGPHGVLWTHADEINKELIPFLGEAGEFRPSPSRERPLSQTLQ